MKKIILLPLIMAFCVANLMGQPTELTVSDDGFYPEDIVIVNNTAYVSGLGDGTIRSFDLTQPNPTAQLFAEAEAGFTQAWGLKSDGTILLSLLDNADFTGGAPGPSKLVEYDIVSGQKTAEWDLPAGAIGHTVSIVDGKYYVTDFGSPRIMEVDPAMGTVNESWFTSAEWDPTISGIGGTIYDNEGGFYVSQGNKLWYLPISEGAPGTLQEVAVAGLDLIDADGITWVESQNTLFFATNDTGDPANVGTVYKLVFSDDTAATGSVVATGLDDSSGLWYYENDDKAYVFVLESQFGGLFGVNEYEAPFNIEIIELASGVPTLLTTEDADFFPEDIVIANNIAYVSGLGDGTVKTFNLNVATPTAETFAEAEAGFTQAWGLKSDGTILLSLLDNADFTGGAPGPSKLVEYDIASGQKTAEWDLPGGAIGHTVSIVEGKYYVTDFGSPRIMEVDPATDMVNESWFTSAEWDPTISGIGGTIYDNEGGFYVSQGNKLWYLPIANGTPGMLQEVAVAGLDIIDADGITWVESQNTLFYATNDTGDPADVGTVYKLVFSSPTTATGSVVATGLDDSSGLWYYENGGEEYVLVLESQFGALFGLNEYEPPFNIEILAVDTELTNEEKTIALIKAFETGNPEVLNYINPDNYINHNLSAPPGVGILESVFSGNPTGFTASTARSYEIGDIVVTHNVYGGTWNNGVPQVAFDVFRFEDGLIVEHWDNLGDIVDDMDGTSQTDGTLTPVTDTANTAANQTLLEELAQTLFIDGDWTNVRSFIDIDNYIQHSVGAGPDGAFLETLEGQTGISFYTDVKFIHTLGNFGLIMSQGPDITGQDSVGTYAYYDLFRIENGRVVEHWDVIQLIPPVEEWANSFGKWGDDALVSTQNTLTQTTKVKVIPNPMNETAIFEIELEQGGIYDFQILDANGKLISSDQLSMISGINQISYNGSRLPAGIYFYRIVNNTGYLSGKMIKVD